MVAAGRDPVDARTGGGSGGRAADTVARALFECAARDCIDARAAGSGAGAAVFAQASSYTTGIANFKGGNHVTYSNRGFHGRHFLAAVAGRMADGARAAAGGSAASKGCARRFRRTGGVEPAAPGS